jgi:hypothetical protein
MITLKKMKKIHDIFKILHYNFFLSTKVIISLWNHQMITAVLKFMRTGIVRIPSIFFIKNDTLPAPVYNFLKKKIKK